MTFHGVGMDFVLELHIAARIYPPSSTGHHSSSSPLRTLAGEGQVGEEASDPHLRSP